MYTACYGSAAMDCRGSWTLY